MSWQDLANQINALLGHRIHPPLTGADVIQIMVLIRNNQGDTDESNRIRHNGTAKASHQGIRGDEIDS